MRTAHTPISFVYFISVSTILMKSSCVIVLENRLASEHLHLSNPTEAMQLVSSKIG
jgi:hypothetical protein